MSQAGEGLQRLDPGRALTRPPEGHGAGAWADLRPAVRWFQGRRPVLLGAIPLIAAQVVTRVLAPKHRLNSGFLPVSGVADSVVLTGPDAPRLCVGDVEVGNLVPALNGPALPESG